MTYEVMPARPPAGREAAKAAIEEALIQFTRAYVRSVLDGIEHGKALGFLNDLDLHAADRGKLLEQAHRLRRVICPENEWDAEGK